MHKLHLQFWVNSYWKLYLNIIKPKFSNRNPKEFKKPAYYFTAKIIQGKLSSRNSKEFEKPANFFTAKKPYCTLSISAFQI